MFNRCSRKVFKVDETETKRIEEPQKKLSIYTTKDLRIIIDDLAEKNRDWSQFPLSKNFLGKYNAIEGIFPEYKDYAWTSWNANLDLSKKEVFIQEAKFDVDYSVEWFLNIEKDAGVGNYYRWIRVNVTYLINDQGEIDDLIKGEPNLLYEDGAPNREYDKEVTKDNFVSLLKEVLLLDAYNKFAPHYKNPKYIKKEPYSKKLCDKVLNIDENVFRVYKDFFGKPEAGGGGICIPKETTIEEAFNNREVYVVCYVYPEGTDPYYDDVEPNRYFYKVNFMLDEEKKLDDFSVEYIKEISNEELKNYNFN